MMNGCFQVGPSDNTALDWYLDKLSDVRYKGDFLVDFYSYINHYLPIRKVVITFVVLCSVKDKIICDLLRRLIHYFKILGI